MKCRFVVVVWITIALVFLRHCMKHHSAAAATKQVAPAAGRNFAGEDIDFSPGGNGLLVQLLSPRKP